MANFEIPNSLGQVRQGNRGDIFYELWSSKNIDLNSSPGKVKVSRKLRRVLTEGVEMTPGDEFQGKVRALLVYTNLDAAGDRKHYYAFTNDSGFRCSIDNDPRVAANWSLVAAGIDNDLSDSTDAVVFDGIIRISTATNIARFNGGGSYSESWWTSDIGGSALTSGKPHTLHVHRGGQETILVTDNNLVRYYNTTATHTTLTLASRFVANTLASGVDTIWVGTYSETNSKALVYEFNIGNTLPNAAYEVNGQAVMSMDVIDNVPYIITDRGDIQVFNGNGFTTITQFPYAGTGKTLFGVSPGIYSFAAPPVFPKGMRAHNRSLYINLASTGQGIRPVDERTPSGVWEYNIDTGVLHHRYSISDATTDYGYVRQNEAGPLLFLDKDEVNIMVGAGTAIDGLYMDSTETPQGYFITPEYYGDSIQQAWEKVHATAFLNGGSIAFKYRTSKKANYPLYVTGVTWLDGTRFTSTTDLSNVEVGDEVEIISIYGAGKLAHVTAIESSALTWTITLDESIGAAGQTSNVRFQNWQKLPTEYTSGCFASIGITKVSPMLQLKVQITGDVELARLITKGNAKTLV